MMAHTETKVLTAHIPLPLADKIDQLAARLERSRGWIVKQALIAWVDTEEERSRLTREAMADVAAGRVIDHQPGSAAYLQRRQNHRRLFQGPCPPPPYRSPSSIHADLTCAFVLILSDLNSSVKTVSNNRDTEKYDKIR
jgi:predicted transcriptional regulator